MPPLVTVIVPVPLVKEEVFPDPLVELQGYAVVVFQPLLAVLQGMEIFVLAMVADLARPVIKNRIPASSESGRTPRIKNE